jgi:hypothetical protein
VETASRSPHLLSPRCERSSAGPSPACYGRRGGARVETCPPGQCAAVARAGAHVALAAMRAITHVEGKVIRSSRRARRGAGCWLRTTMVASSGTPILSSLIAWRRASAARRPLAGARMPGWASQWGRVRSATLRTIQRRSVPGVGLRPLSPAVAVVGTRADSALACRPLRPSRGAHRGACFSTRSGSERGMAGHRQKGRAIVARPLVALWRGSVNGRRCHRRRRPRPAGPSR